MAETFTPPVFPQLASQPSSESNVAEKYGFTVFIIGLACFVLFKNNDGTPILSQTGFVITIAALLFWILIIRFTRQYLKERLKQKKVIKKPFNPEKEIPQLEQKILQDFGYRVITKRWIPEPEFGRASAEDEYKIHFQGYYIDFMGVLKPITWSISSTWRNIISFEPDHVHIETKDHSWSNARKAQDQYISPFSRRPTVISFEPSEEQQQSEEEKEDEEDEE